ncbi:MAG: iron ABC transporter permease [Pseudomonadota bacterium]
MASAHTSSIEATPNQFTPRQQSLPWGLFAVAFLLILPALAVLSSLAGLAAPRATDIGAERLATTVTYFQGTVFLCLGVGVVASVLGVTAACLVTLCRFPGRAVFSIALLLPFAVPAYIAAYCYGDFLSPFGGLRSVFAALGVSLSPSMLPNIRSLPGAIMIIALTVYPYVYMAVRADLTARSDSFLEVARSLGTNRVGAIINILLPCARPAILGGLALALMETAADFGVSDYFGIRTLTTGIFRTWYGLGDLTAAAQLASGLFVVAAFLVLLDEVGRRARYNNPVRRARPIARLALSPLASLAAIVFCAIPVVLGFVVPVGVLVAHSIGTGLSPTSLQTLWAASGNTLFFALGAAVVIMGLAVLLGYGARRSAASTSNSKATTIIIRMATLGYAIPGAVIAVGILFVSGALFKPLGFSVTQGGILVLLYAYVARFITAGYNAAHGGLTQISPLMDMAGRSLGVAGARLVRTVHVPLALPALASGAIIVMIDVSRELPATLLLRPFNVETLATSVYRLAADERLDAAAPMALALIIAGLIPLSLLAVGRRPHHAGAQTH